MKNRAALVALTAAALVVSVSAAGCTVIGSASPGMTSSSSQPTSQQPVTTSATLSSTPTTAGQQPAGAPITVLPPPSTTTPTTSTAETTSPDKTTTATSPAPDTATVAETTADAPTRPADVVPSGTVVVIDPGHNGGNASHPEIINKQVPAGFGQYKACNTTGTATNAGYPEHAFTWKVSVALRDILQSNGITVRMTRDSDDGVGPCVNERAAVGNDANAAAVISIHGDGEAANIGGFFVMTASRAPAGADIAAATADLAASIRDSMVAGGFPASTALGRNGLWARNDLGGLNLSLRPSVMIECGNMRNAAEAAQMSSAAGQQRYAQAIATGVLAFLARTDQSAAR